VAVSLEQKEAELQQQETTQRRGFGFITAGEIVREAKPPDYLIPGFLERDSLAQLVGKPRCGKSLQALDWCACVATGSAWNGKPIQAQPAVYICGEGRNGIARRLKAWEIEHRTELKDAPLFISTSAAHLLNQETAAEVFHCIKETSETPPGLIVIDTLARNFGGNENSTEDMSALIKNMDDFLREPFGACVMIVHHTGHAARDTGRGSSAMIGAIDASYHMRQNAPGLVTLSPVKIKDGELPADVLQEIKAIEMPGFDHFGNQYTAPVLVDDSGTAKPTEAAKLGTNQQKALRALRVLTKAIKQDAEPGEPIRVEISTWREQCKSSGIDRHRWKETSNSLMSNGLVRIEGIYVYTSE